MDVRQTAGKGLMFLFIAQILVLGSIIPFIGIFVALAALVLSLYAFYTLSSAGEQYKNAFTLTIIVLVISIVKIFAGDGFLSAILDIATSVINLIVVFYVCNGTADLLRGIDDGLVNRAGLIWKMYMICTVVMIICEFLVLIPIINIIAGLTAIVILIVQFVASILYLIFLWSSQKVLQSSYY